METKLSKNFSYILLMQGQSISRMGSIIFSIIMSWKIYQITQSGFLSALYIAVETISRSVAKQFAGILIDNFNKVKVVYMTDFINGANILIVYLVINKDGNQFGLVFILYVLALFKGITDAFFSPAIYALIPALVGDKELDQAYSINQISYQIAGIVGMSFGSIIIAYFDIKLLVLINAISYIYSGISELFIKGSYVNRIDRKGFFDCIKNIKNDYICNTQFIFNNQLLRFELLIGILVIAVTAPIIKPILLSVISEFGNTESFMYISLASAIGSIIANYLISTKRIDIKKWTYTKSQSIYTIIFLVYALMIFVMKNIHLRFEIFFFIIALIIIFMSFINPVITIKNTSQIVRNVDKNVLGSILGIRGSYQDIVQAGGMVIFGMMLDLNIYSVMILLLIINILILFLAKSNENQMHLKNLQILQEGREIK